MFAVFGRWLARQVHPGAGSLVAFADGESGPLAKVWVKEHLTVCPSCRREVERLQEDLTRFQLFVRPTPDEELEQGLRNLRQAMGQLVHNVNPVRAADLDSVARRQFLAELETYFGRRAAATLLGGLSQDNRLHELVSASWPALAALLGRKTAEAITARVFKPQGFDSGAAW